MPLRLRLLEQAACILRLDLAGCRRSTVASPRPPRRCGQGRPSSARASQPVAFLTAAPAAARRFGSEISPPPRAELPGWKPLPRGAGTGRPSRPARPPATGAAGAGPRAPECCAPPAPRPPGAPAAAAAVLLNYRVLAQRRPLRRGAPPGLACGPAPGGRRRAKAQAPADPTAAPPPAPQPPGRLGHHHQRQVTRPAAARKAIWPSLSGSPPLEIHGPSCVCTV